MVRLFGAFTLMAVIAASCQAPGMGDAEPTPTRTPGPATSGGPTQQVQMATFTPTVEGATPEADVTQEAERAAEQTAAAVTATHQAENPEPAGTPNATPVNPSDNVNPNATASTENALAPPRARLLAGGEQIDSTFGTYSWQFADTMESFVKVQAPLMELTDVALSAGTGAEATLELYGDQYTEPPQEITVSGYDYEATTAIPQTPQGQTANELAFAPQPDAEVLLEASPDPQSPTFTLPEEPGHYIFRVEASWGPHPQVEGERLFVTYVFNVIVE